ILDSVFDRIRTRWYRRRTRSGKSVAGRSEQHSQKTQCGVSLVGGKKEEESSEEQKHHVKDGHAKRRKVSVHQTHQPSGQFGPDLCPLGAIISRDVIQKRNK
ncbi:AAEL014175-PA, partial [Aedes aegypti]